MRVWYFTVIAIFEVAFFVIVRGTRDQSEAHWSLRLVRTLCHTLRNISTVTFPVLLSVYLL